MPEQNITTDISQLMLGLNLDNILSQIKSGQYTYLLNGICDNFDGNSLTVQNEEGNVLCTNFPMGYKVVGVRNIIEKNIILFWLANGISSELGTLNTNTCIYTKYINDPCIGLDPSKPILKAVHKITNCTTEVYWTDGGPRKFVDLDNPPYREIQGEGCENIITTEVDCNKMLVQPNFKIPQLDVIDVDSDGELIAGTYQFAIQYSNGLSEAYTSYYSITNPLSIFDPNKITQDFNYSVGKSIRIDVSNIDDTGFYDYFNLAVIQTVNNIPTPYLVGTYKIVNSSQSIVYNGTNKTQIALSLFDITEKYPIYDTAGDLTTAQDILIWDNLTTTQRLNYQPIWNKISLQWETWRLKKSNKPYADELDAANIKGYFRDEVYAIEGCFLLANGEQTDSCIISSRLAIPSDLTPIFNNDVVGDISLCETQQPLPRWKVYNTGKSVGKYPNTSDPCFEGPYEWGEFAYWESLESYPCNTDIWEALSNTPIRHHKFPDSTITHIRDEDGYVYPIGIKFDVQQLIEAIRNSSLTQEQKNNIVGFKITRGNRANNKSVVARGLVNNVGTYTRDNSTYFYPNYPYNDLGEDPFINSEQNSVFATGGNTGNGIIDSNLCITYTLINTNDGDVVISYNACGTNVETFQLIRPNGAINICSQSRPSATPGVVISTNNVLCTEGGSNNIGSSIIPGISPLRGFGPDAQKRYTFHSPDTSFYQPTLGSILKLETAEYGKSKGHYQQVKDHAKYRFVSNEAAVSTLAFAVAIGFASGSYGLGSTQVFDGTAAWTAYQAISDIIFKLIPKKNFAYQFNSFGDYNKYIPILDTGDKQRRLDLAIYAIPGFIATGDEHPLNNFQRESSVYLRTTLPLPFVSDVSNIPRDSSRWTVSEESLCNNSSAIVLKDISSYYSTIKKEQPSQYGQLYSYETIDTGFQHLLDISQNISPILRYKTVFGGDCFINKFAYKQKLPFFIDNRVGNVDESDVFYDEIGNIGFPKYWFSTDVKKGSLSGLFGIKAHNFDCNGNSFFYDSGIIYLFSYGVPYFWCESEVNVDLRQAFNNKEGDFYPRVSSDIPDEWLQETNTTIQQDNTYFYNKTYSRQNQNTNTFSHLPEDFSTDTCRTSLPFRAIFSEKQEDVTNYRRNNWLIYRPAAKFDFPQNFGALTSLDGIENRQVLARFENKSLLYNVLLTAPTSAADVYLGQTLFSSQVPPLDYADTDLGYVGSQHKFLLKTEYGHITADAKRGQIFIIQGQNIKELTNENVSKFFTEFLQFEINKVLPEYSIDNSYNGCGLTGVYDPKYDRFILTKIDYKPLLLGISYINGIFVYNNQQIELTDATYFCNNSFTISYSFKTQSWTSFHSYIPNYYIGNSSFFYSGINNEISSIWKHNSSFTLFNNFYGAKHQYIIEYPISYKGQDEILQCIKDYSRILQYTNYQQFIETDDYYFSHAVIYNSQQCSGTLKLTKKPKNNLQSYNTYPVYHTLEKEILFTKSNSFYNFNTFWSLNKSSQQPIWLKSCQSLSVYKELNEANMNYGKRAFNKAPMMAKGATIRLINKEYDTLKFISQILLTQSQVSYK